MDAAHLLPLQLAFLVGCVDAAYHVDGSPLFRPIESFAWWSAERIVIVYDRTRRKLALKIHATVARGTLPLPTADLPPITSPKYLVQAILKRSVLFAPEAANK